MARQIIIIENFEPDPQAMQAALEFILRKGGGKYGKGSDAGDGTEATASDEGAA